VGGFGGSPRSQAATVQPYILWIVRRSAVGKRQPKAVGRWLNLVDKINQDSTNGWVGKSTSDAAVEPKASPSAGRALLFPKVRKYHQRYCVERPMRHIESEEVPAGYALIHIFLRGPFLLTASGCPIGTPMGTPKTSTID
jgi:hypothetical protein